MGGAETDDAAARIARIEPGRGLREELRCRAAILGQHETGGDVPPEMEMNERFVAHE